MRVRASLASAVASARSAVAATFAANRCPARFATLDLAGDGDRFFPMINLSLCWGSARMDLDNVSLGQGFKHRGRPGRNSKTAEPNRGVLEEKSPDKFGKFLLGFAAFLLIRGHP